YKMQTGQLTYNEEYFDLNELVRETVCNLRAATRSHQLLLEDEVQAQVLGDKDRLGQVLINLITNAIKYSPQADKVMLSISIDAGEAVVDRKSTRLNSSHRTISYAVFCLKKKNKE